MGPQNYRILEYGKRDNMKLGTWNKVILTFELGNIPLPLGSPSCALRFPIELYQSESRGRVLWFPVCQGPPTY